MADPRFPRGGDADRKGGVANLLFGQISQKNGMKMKRIDPEVEAHVPGTTLDPPMITNELFLIETFDFQCVKSKVIREHLPVAILYISNIYILCL